ncbi:sulfite exporter TauE/SafE family protein [Reinekea sp. G2M2-21]|uniref:sulfite exporter TauE/SafE family protein n=1 Tax=Reinekea sp. G2M2-21 TaxID=2788942 RepID=UPI0018A887BD|nr:sulfite exporter TauE/SafE family protein [Reinekea sp. G2M2-21]
MFDLYWWLAAGALFLGCAVQTALGFGMAVIAAPIIVLFRPEWVPVIMTIVALVLSVQNALSQRSGIEWKHISPAMISRIPGTILGAWVLTLMPVEMLQVMVAIMVFAAIFVTAFARPFPATAKNLTLAGFISGITGTTTSIGGPPMALVMQHAASHNTRANLSIYFVYSCITSLISYQLLGVMNTTLWLTGFSFIPVAFLGYVVGINIRGWVDLRFRPLLLVLCSISAFIALYGAVF